MWASSGAPLASTGASAATLRLVSAALKTGQVTSPVSAFAVLSVAPGEAPLASELQRLSADGMSITHLALVVDLAAAAADARLSADSVAELVWTGPEAATSRSRDTAVVIDELFAHATRSILISTFTVYQPERVFAALARRVAEVPGLSVRLFLHVARKEHDTRLNAVILDEFATRLAAAWPKGNRPAAYYDPRGLSEDPQFRASLHAKCLVVDDEVAFVTSANFTEWARDRNVEAGVLVRSRHFALQLRTQFDALVAGSVVLRLPRF